MSRFLADLREVLSDVNALETSVRLLDWDQQTYMPHGGSTARAEHISILTRLAHETFTSEETGRLLARAVAQSEDDQALIRVTQREYDLRTKLPSALVEKKAKAAVIGHSKWVEARKNNDFKSFAPILEELFDLARQEAGCYGYSDDIYTALLDTYEEGATATSVREMFDTIKGPQIELIRRIAECPEPSDAFLYGDWPEIKQASFTEYLVKSIGFDFSCGRQDTAAHPFCTSFSSSDVRLTTRFQRFLPCVIFGSLHEAGHGLYEQGSPKEWDRTPLAGGVSLGLHESQSRLWENLIGRSPAFWQWAYGSLQSSFPEFQSVPVGDFVRAVNKVQPSLIRVEADELTYNLHIIIRFEIESAVLSNQLAVSDIPEAWNAKYEAYLGVRPDSDANGCLQDVHWSSGSIGYFPTYTMGNLLSYQFWNTMGKDIGDPYDLVRQGEFRPILEWLQRNIYAQARKYTPKELITRVTGQPMSPEPYLEGLAKKYTELYGL